DARQRDHRAHGRLPDGADAVPEVLGIAPRVRLGDVRRPGQAARSAATRPAARPPQDEVMKGIHSAAAYPSPGRFIPKPRPPRSRRTATGRPSNPGCTPLRDVDTRGPTVVGSGIRCPELDR